MGSPLATAGVRLHVMRRLLVSGRAPTAEETAEEQELDPARVADAYRELAASHAIELFPGTMRIWMAHPLSAVPTGTSATVDGRDHFANCIWDGLGVVAMLGGTGAVRTLCGDCGETLDVEVRRREVVAATARTVHFAVPASEWYEDIGAT
jgi:hypothetical protein